MNRLSSIALSLLLALAATVVAQPAPNAEARAARAYLSARAQGPEALRAFLERFPKGSILHMHLTGAVYAESFLRQAAGDGLCVDPDALSLAQPPCVGKLIPAAQLVPPAAAARQALYDRLVDAFSMRSFVPTSGWSGHDQFFATFSRFGALPSTHAGEWVDEVASRAAAQNVQYLEILQTPTFAHTATLGRSLGWPTGKPDFAALRQQLLDRGLRDEVAADLAGIHTIEENRLRLERCATSQAAPACQLSIRYLYQILRGNPPEQVFAQTLLGFETVAAAQASREPGFVGLNFVMPEDGFLSMRDYTLQMQMLDYLHSVYPQVHITLHAGELAEGLVPPEGLTFHIRQAVELGHAERIGHGVDVMHETDARALLKEMADRHVMVEINLSSNEGILGVTGIHHPFPLYRAAHVPVALSTDDEGVSRIDITHEYVRAALDYNLGYGDLKDLARTGLEHSFLPGSSLWASPDLFRAPAPACKADALGSAHPSSACAAWLKANEKAATQWRLEAAFRAFEANQ